MDTAIALRTAKAISLITQLCILFRFMEHVTPPFTEPFLILKLLNIRILDELIGCSLIHLKVVQELKVKLSGSLLGLTMLIQKQQAGIFIQWLCPCLSGNTSLLTSLYNWLLTFLFLSRVLSNRWNIFYKCWGSYKREKAIAIKGDRNKGNKWLKQKVSVFTKSKIELPLTPS